MTGDLDIEFIEKFKSFDSKFDDLLKSQSNLSTCVGILTQSFEDHKTSSTAEKKELREMILVLMKDMRDARERAAEQDGALKLFKIIISIPLIGAFLLWIIGKIN